VEIFNIASEGGYVNKYWCAGHELLGTAFLLLAVNWGTISGYTPQAVGLTVFAFAIVLGPVSGGHFNPAITIALFMRECRRNFFPNLLVALLYISAQIVGGLIGVIVALLGIGLA